jgi:taurine dioxygenase
MKAFQHCMINPVAGVLGAEVEGIQLARIDDATFGELQAALLEYQVLFFRDQQLTRDEQKDFGRRFGALHVHPFEQPLKNEGHPEIIVFKSGADFPFVSGAWHADATFLDEPPFASILRCIDAPDFGGDTMWASTYAAYEALSDKIQRVLSGLVAIHDTGRAFAVAAYRRERIDGENALKMVSAEHPVVLTHPETGRKALYVNSHFTSSFKGMKTAESGAILTFLFRHIELPEFSCRFRWRPNSVAMWDNRCTQHRAIADNPTAPRHLERVALVANFRASDRDDAAERVAIDAR